MIVKDLLNEWDEIGTVALPGTLPEEVETLVADGTVDIRGGVSRFAQDLHRNSFKELQPFARKT